MAITSSSSLLGYQDWGFVDHPSFAVMAAGPLGAAKRAAESVMQRYRYEIDNVRSHLRSLWAVIALQLLFIVALWIGWMRMPSSITVHIPPDLRSGSVMALDEVPAANVYAFAFYIFQQLNRWPEDGAEDYGKAIFRIAAYLTPEFRSQLIADMR